MRRRRQPSAESIVRLGPASPIALIGREAERKEITGASGPLVIVAPAGMGKTALVRTLPGAVGVCCHAGDTAAAVEARVRRQPADRWVVEDVHHLGDEAAALVENLGRVIATSERRLPVGRSLELSPLPIADARSLWHRLEEVFGPTPKDACDAALERVRGVPLALRREFAQALLGVKRPWDVASLEPNERSVLEAISVLVGPAAPASLAHLGDRRSDATIEGALRSLSRRQLVTALPDGRFEAHDVVRAAVLAAMSAEDRRDLEKRAAALEGGTAAPRSWERFDATPAPLDDVSAVCAAIRHLHAAGNDDAAASRLVDAEDLFVRRGACAEGLAAAAPLAGDLASFRAGMLLRLGRVNDARALAPNDAVRRAEIALEMADLPAAEKLGGRALASRIAAEKSGRPAPIDESRLGEIDALCARVQAARAAGAELRALHAERELAELNLLRGRAGRAAEIAAGIARRATEGGLLALARDARVIGAAAEADDLRAADAFVAASALMSDPAVGARAARIVVRTAPWLGGAQTPTLGNELDDDIARGEAAWSDGDAASALEALTRAAPLAERANRKATLARILADAARLHHAFGHRAAAENASARALSDGAEVGADRAVARALLVTAALAREAGDLTVARRAAQDALTVARAAGLVVERALAAGAAEALCRIAADTEAREMLGNIARAAAATLAVPARSAVERMLGELGLAQGCAFRTVTADGTSSYAPTAAPALATSDRKDLAVDGVNERVVRRGRVVADLRRRTLLKRLLFLFAGAPGRLFAKEDIVSRVWGVSYHPLRHDAALFTNVMRLRRLLGENGQDILRVGEGGYRFVPPPDFVFIEKL